MKLLPRDRLNGCQNNLLLSGPAERLPSPARGVQLPTSDRPHLCSIQWTVRSNSRCGSDRNACRTRNSSGSWIISASVGSVALGSTTPDAPRPVASHSNDTPVTIASRNMRSVAGRPRAVPSQFAIAVRVTHSRCASACCVIPALRRAIRTLLEKFMTSLPSMKCEVNRNRTPVQRSQDCMQRCASGRS